MTAVQPSTLTAPDGIVLCNLSGRGDKDVHTIAAREGVEV